MKIKMKLLKSQKLLKVLLLEKKWYGNKVIMLQERKGPSYSKLRSNKIEISLFKEGYKPFLESCPDNGYWLLFFKRKDC